MPEIRIKLKNCIGCPYLETNRQYTADSFETCFKWTCKKSDKVIANYVDWNEDDRIKIPEWCEILVK